MLFPTFLQKTGKKSKPAGREADRGGEKTEKLRQNAGQAGQPPPDRGTEEAEVKDRAQADAGGHIQPDPAVPQGQGAGKEEKSGGEPEEEIQQGCQKAGAGSQAKLPETIVKESQEDAGGQTQRQGVGLGGGGDAHPRRRRERKEVCSRGSS